MGAAAASTSGKALTQIALIGDGHGMIDAVEPMLRRAYGTRTMTLDTALADETPLPAVSVFCLGRLQRRDATRIADAAMQKSTRPILLFPSYRLAQVELALEIGVAECMMAPLDEPALVASVRRALNAAAEARWSQLKPAETQALQASRASFGALMQAGADGRPLPLAEVNDACEDIHASLGVSNVGRWLDALRQHHDNTYRHSMFVCGVLAHFARSLGILGDDLRELTVGGFLHDAGKAKIPLPILDKPGKLDDDEWEVMRTHPSHSREILLREHGLTPRAVRMAVHHHEKLDGRGYPDGLSAAQIDDAVRLTAIADVYAALTEERAYKPAMPPEQALEIMAGFKGHLDLDLVRAFRTFVLDQVPSHATAA